MLQDLLVNFIVAIVSSLCTAVFQNRKTIKIYFQALKRWNKEIRLSCAYLFRIKINNEYLLIKGNNISQYQPVGGVYKYFESFYEKKDLWEISDESKDNFYENKDLRQRTKGKYLSKYIEWFVSKKNREVSVYRELIEELDLGEASQLDLVKETEIEFIKTIKEPIKYSTHFQVDEQKIFNVFEVRLSKKTIKQIEKEPKFILVERNEIEKLCSTVNGKSYPIAETAKYII